MKEGSREKKWKKRKKNDVKEGEHAPITCYNGGKKQNSMKEGRRYESKMRIPSVCYYYLMMNDTTSYTYIYNESIINSERREMLLQQFVILII